MGSTYLHQRRLLSPAQKKSFGPRHRHGRQTCLSIKDNLKNPDMVDLVKQNLAQ